MKCKICEVEHNRKSKYCSRDCYLKNNYRENKETRTTYQKKYTKINPIYKKNYDKQHLVEKRPLKREYNNNRYKNVIKHRLSMIMRNRIYDALKNNRKTKNSINLLGCSIECFIQHIERQFSSNMTWENYGKDWEIDHIKSIFMFDLSIPEQQKECFHWSNQRPLWKTTDIAVEYGYYNIIGNRNREKIIRC